MRNIYRTFGWIITFCYQKEAGYYISLIHNPALLILTANMHSLHNREYVFYDFKQIKKCIVLKVQLTLQDSSNVLF